MGLRHLSLAVADLQAMADALIAKGVQMAGELADGRAVQGQRRPFFVYDPDHIPWDNTRRLTPARNHHSSLHIPAPQRGDDCDGQRWYPSSCCAEWPAGHSAGLVGLAALRATRHQRCTARPSLVTVTALSRMM
jgi:hypothetical protein